MASLSGNSSATEDNETARYVDILLVEDEAAFRSLIEVCLLRSGYLVHSVADGAAAMEFLKTGCARVLVSDIYMPIHDGYELLVALRETHPGMPKIVMSGRAAGSEELFVKAARHLGANFALKKPFRLGELITYVEALIGPAKERTGEASSSRDKCP